MKKKPEPETKLSDMLNLEGTVQKRQRLVVDLVNTRKAAEILLIQLSKDDIVFNVGALENGGVQFRGQVARDIQGACLEKVTARQKDIEAELEQLGVKIDDRKALDAAAGVTTNRKEKRARKAVARKKRKR